MLKKLALSIALLAGLVLWTTQTLAQEHNAPAEPAKAAIKKSVDAGHEAQAAGESAAGEHGRTHQLIEFDAANAVWVLIIFIVLLVILYPTAWKGVLAGLKAREEHIRREIADAEAARSKAEETLKQYTDQLATAQNKVRDLIAKASADGQRIAEEIRTQAQKEAEGVKQKSLVEIDAAKKQAIGEIYEQTAVLATSVAEKILRRSLNADDQRDLVKSSLEQLKNVN